MSQIALAGKGLLYAAAIGLAAWLASLVISSAVLQWHAGADEDDLRRSANPPRWRTGPEIQDWWDSPDARAVVPAGTAGAGPPSD